jgi:hypothetical protein
LVIVILSLRQRGFPKLASPNSGQQRLRILATMIRRSVEHVNSLVFQGPARAGSGLSLTGPRSSP